jgi:hypothetical protein
MSAQRITRTTSTGAVRAAGARKAVAAVATGVGITLALLGAVVLALQVAGVVPLHGGAHAGHEHDTVLAAGGVQVNVERWQWMSHDHFGGPTPQANNFPMPAQMMPGLQSDDKNRLHVVVTAFNTNDGPSQVSGADFEIQTTGGKQIEDNTPSDGSGGQVNVDSATQTSFDLYFDLPLADNVKDMVFQHDGESVVIPYGAAQPQHQHAY